jgi:hypothetical protein
MDVSIFQALFYNRVLMYLGWMFLTVPPSAGNFIGIIG